jgi:hypothetical protein
MNAAWSKEHADTSGVGWAGSPKTVRGSDCNFELGPLFNREPVQIVAQHQGDVFVLAESGD